MRRLTKARKSELVRAAVAARERAVATYSQFRVGAALLAADGSVTAGANVESASYGLTCCAERVALFKALTEGRLDFVAIAVAAPVRGGVMPCGACRQLLAEYAPEAVVLTVDSERPDGWAEFRVAELIPRAFVGPVQEARAGLQPAPSARPAARTTIRKSAFPAATPRGPRRGGR
ncbi:MAG: cytidine deaminase [Limisphaerales bacterium]